jgi:endogenous inhibitor of DNA gyrase (YacG/DUF329 family)
MKKDSIDNYTVNGIPARDLFEKCWHRGCLKEIPKERRGMYEYFCSEECKKADEEYWKKKLKDAGLIP